MNKVIKILIFTATFALAVSCGNKSSDKKTDGQSSAEAVAEQVLKIATATALEQDVPQTESYSSTVQAYAINNIAPQSSNRIARVNVEVGDFVSRGQALVVMDQVQLNQAKLTLVNDSTEYARLKSLYDEGGVSKSDLDATELAYNVARSQYRNLLENSVLRAPVSGVITARNYDKGDMYSIGQPIYVLQQITPVKLLVGVSESDYTKVRKGQEVTLTVDAFPDRTFTGTVNRLYPTMDEQSHTFSVEVIVPNTDRALRPGMYANVTISFGNRRSVVVPDEAVVKQQGSAKRFVYILQDDNTVKSSEVTLGKHFDSNYEILSGLSDGDVVATRGSNNLRNGSKVEVVSE